MICIKDKTTPDYENAGNLYCVEISTDSAKEFELIKYCLQQMKIEAQYRNIYCQDYKENINGK